MKKVNIDPSTGCWIYTGYVSQKGYGQIQRNGKVLASHRYTYEQCVGPIPDGMELHHICKNRACCNPEHLQAISHSDHLRLDDVWKVPAAIQRSKTHCKRGHPFNEENTYIYKGIRHCRACKNEQWRKWYARKRTKLSSTSA